MGGGLNNFNDVFSRINELDSRGLNTSNTNEQELGNYMLHGVSTPNTEKVVSKDSGKKVTTTGATTGATTSSAQSVSTTPAVSQDSVGAIDTATRRGTGQVGSVVGLLSTIQKSLLGL